MNWEHVATGALTALVAITVVRRLVSHSRRRDVHIEWRFDWHTDQHDATKGDDDDSNGGGTVQR